ncbi:MAG: extracellular solute-binding protein [Patescibacteria group bacterium]|nr:extracellular solute-binding protein [Patescibacteria group bacterium]
MGNKTKIGLAILTLGGLLFLGGCGCKETPASKVAPLEIWGVWDDSDMIEKVISQYKKNNGQISEIKYRKFTYDEYEDELIKAFAAGNGPDIFLAHHTWPVKHLDLMLSLEEAQSIYNKAVEGKSGCKKPPKLMEPLLTERQYREAFVNVAGADFIKSHHIYGMPLTVDTMALFYNEDLLANVGIAQPPTTWDEFKKDAERLTRVDEYNNIIQAGAAMGTADNVYRAGDILAMLMLQSGCSIVNPETLESSVDVKTQSQDTGKLIWPAMTAMDFYTSFADGASPNYSWNSRMHHSVDAFIEGRVAMMINYTYAIETIKSKAPQLNFKVAGIPQIKEANPNDKSTYANYWGYVVSRESAEIANKPLEAWRFVKFLGGEEQVSAYTEITKQPASRKDVIQKQMEQPDLGIFAQQALIAESFFQPDEVKIQKIFNDNIERAALGWQSNKEAVEKINTKLEVLLKEYRD